MAPFVKFIFSILVVGIVVNMGIVLMANARSQRTQAVDAVVEKDLFREQLKRLNEIGRLQRMDITVEWQQDHARDGVMTTSLLVRQYVVSNEGDLVPRPLVRVQIPGNRVSADGLLLQVDSLFHEPDFEMLQGKNLVYFAHVFAESEPDADRYSLLVPGQVPDLTRIHPGQPLPTFYEIQLWQFLWDLIPDPPRGVPTTGITAGMPPSVDPRVARGLRRGLKVTWTPPASRAVKVGDTLSAFISLDGMVTLEPANSPGLRNSMLEEADDMAARKKGLLPPPREPIPSVP